MREFCDVHCNIVNITAIFKLQEYVRFHGRKCGGERWRKEKIRQLNE